MWMVPKVGTHSKGRQVFAVLFKVLLGGTIYSDLDYENPGKSPFL